MNKRKMFCNMEKQLHFSLAIYLPIFLKTVNHLIEDHKPQNIS